METSPRTHERGGSGSGSGSPYPSLLPSPTSSSSTTTNNGVILHNHHSLLSPSTPHHHHHHQHHHHHHQQLQNPPVTRCESNPYPTTFVQADTSSFKQVVQMLTGSSETVKSASSNPKPGNPIPPIKSVAGKSKPSKLYERRNSLKNNLLINPLVPGFGSSVTEFSPRNATEILSPSILDFPALVLSPVTPLIPDPFNRSPGTGTGIVVDKAAEEKAIAEKGFFLHPSPVSTPRDSEPRLLPLFPVTSPGFDPSSC